MATIDQNRVVSGFDVEALIGANYIRAILQTAFDAGTIPASAVFGDTEVFLAMHDERLYAALADEDGVLPTEHSEAFESEILSGHPLGADLRVRLIAHRENDFVFPFDLFLQLGLNRRPVDGVLEEANIAIHVVDIDSVVLPALAEPPLNLSKDDVLAATQEFVDRSIDLGNASSLKRVEDMEFRKFDGDDEHDPAFGIYLNLRLRNGDEEDQHLPPRGQRNDALNFLPSGEDIAFATRPGLYADLAKDVFSRTAIRNAFGLIEHALRPNLLNPNSRRIGDLDRIRVGQMVQTAGSSQVPVNGLRITVEGEVVDPEKLTNTDVTIRLDLEPKITVDGLLEWKTDFDVNFDALFEFITFWAATIAAMFFGPVGAGAIFGLAFIGQIGAGIFVGELFETRVADKADAALADVIPDRLTIQTRRWDPFYATQHQVVTKPSQAEFNDKGFMLCGKATVGRALVPPADTVIRDEIRTEEGRIASLRYQFADFEKVQRDTALHAVGVHRRPFTPADPAEPDLFALPLEQITDRLNDSEGPLVRGEIPYFPAYIYLRGNQVNQLLCLSGPELKALRNRLREQKIQEKSEEIIAAEGDDIRQQVIADLSADGATPTQEEIDDEFAARVRKKAKSLLSDFEAPTPLEMTHSGMLSDLVRFDVSPGELIDLETSGIITIDSALTAVKLEGDRKYLRDRAGRGEEDTKDNLLERPRYRPGPNGPTFP